MLNICQNQFLKLTKVSLSLGERQHLDKFPFLTDRHKSDIKLNPFVSILFI